MRSFHFKVVKYLHKYFIVISVLPPMYVFINATYHDYHETTNLSNNFIYPCINDSTTHQKCQFMKHTLLGNVINSSMYLQNILCYKWDTFSNMKPAIRFIYLRTIHYICKCLCRWKYIHKCVCTYNGPTCPMWHAKASSNPFILSPEQLVVLQDLKESLALLPGS